jgi:glycosyltransferase involved in cell wall biosynthesis
MRVCVISPGVVHAVPRTIAIAPFFDDIQFVDVTGKADRDAIEAAGVTYYGPSDLPTGRFNYRSTNRLLVTIQPDIIVCHFSSGSHFFNAIAYGKCPVAAIAMGQDVLYDKGDIKISVLRRLLIRMGLRRVFYIAAKSKTLIGRIRRYGVTAPVKLNYWGCNTEIFFPRDKISARNALNLPLDKKIILSPRAIEPRLNIDLIVEAAAEASLRHKDIQLVIVGRSSPDYLEKIQNLIEKHKISCNALILGEVSQDELPQYYAAADIVVSMAHSEGFPNTVLEVMSCETPLVIGDLPQIRELLEDRTHCRICTITVPAITECICEVLENPFDTQIMLRHAKSIACNIADITRNGAQFADDIKHHVDTLNQPKLFSSTLFRVAYLIYRIFVRLKLA